MRNDVKWQTEQHNETTKLQILLFYVLLIGLDFAGCDIDDLTSSLTDADTFVSFEIDFVASLVWSVLSLFAFEFLRKMTQVFFYTH